MLVPSPSRRLAAFGVALALAPVARADVLKVPSAQFPTIQSAVDAAVAFDTIKISPGDYAESVLVQSKTDLVIRGRGVVRITESDSSTPLWIKLCQRVTVRNLRLVDVNGFAGILSDNSTDVTIKNCRVLSSNNAGIWTSLGSDIVILNNRIENCLGSGIESSFLTFGPTLGPGSGSVSSTYSKNRISACGRGINNTSVGNEIAKNRIDTVDGFGVQLAPASQNCTVAKNRVSHSATAFVIDGVFCTIAKNVVSDTLDGHGFEIRGDALDVSKCRARRTSADGFLFEASASGNTIEKCSSKRAGEVGFHVFGTSNGFTKCAAKKSASFDLNDGAGGATTN
ncbi:MAG TPA: right-handed parallel beta-helix repeat-containing protein, partial [Pirellulaceae bacterium]|nr:right-handed parallel beta-helix repeat-containing protein [Pirellulaceae bacterium]